MDTLSLSWGAVTRLASKVVEDIKSKFQEDGELFCYPVPRGGIPAALLVSGASQVPYRKEHGLLIKITESPTDADIFIDDIVDSGKTKETYNLSYPGRPFFALVEQKKEGTWIEFPWERMSKETGPEENITRILQYIGEDPDREGLKETPSRVVRSYGELFSGYKMDVKDVVKTFGEDSVVCDEMVVSKHIEFYSTCEHHMIPFYGVAHVGYVPGKNVIGLSKLARIVDVFSRRLQVQERLTTQITSAIDEALDPKGSACVIEARHLCCMARGVGKQGSSMVTSSLTGVFRKPEVRQEFLSLIR